MVMVATDGLLLVQVPPVVGETPDMAPIQILVRPVILTDGIGLTVTTPVGAEIQPVIEFINVNVTVPDAIPVTTPALVTVAMAGLLLVQLPPEAGDRVVVDPTQMLLAPVILTTGKAFTVMVAVGSEVHPVEERVNVNVTEPAETPVTTPALVTVATAGLLLTQVPPLVGDKVVVKPTQTLLAPVILTVGKGSTLTALVVAEQFGEALLVNVKVADPEARPVTTPALFTEAIAGLLLVQVPPEVGDKVVVTFTQMVLAPVILTTGKALMVTAAVGADTQPVLV